MMKNILKKCFYAFLSVTVLTGCNEEWVDEQYEHYASFKALMDYSQGSTRIYVKYKEDGYGNYKIPILISGSTMPTKDLCVNIGVDNDTLDLINKDHFSRRPDLFYKQLPEENYTLKTTQVTVPANEYTALLDIDFNMKGLNFKEKWVLPLTILDGTDNSSYKAHPRKNYKKAILLLCPFNDYSGTYASTSMEVYFDGENSKPMVSNTRSATVVDEKTIFFYAGLTDETLIEREKYKVFVTFNDDNTLTLKAENPDINFEEINTSTYEIEEKMDAALPYLKHIYITLKMNYKYDDITSTPGYRTRYEAKGSMSMQRSLNTQIPDEDQAILW